MFQENTEDVILKRIMDRIPNDIDKREGSIIYTAVAPIVNEITRMYNDLDRFLGYTFANEGMPEEFLDLRVGEMGITRKEATYGIKKGYFYDGESKPIDIPKETRFSIENFNFKVKEKLEDGIFIMECEEVGSKANFITGSLLPIDYVENLGSATLGEAIILGEEKESNESLYQRYLERLNEKPFGGNIADYKKHIKEINGVGEVKVIPVWNGGGTVKVIITNSNYDIPSKELIYKVQEEIDPVQNQGKGLGVAPIGHVVTVEAPIAFEITFQMRLTLENGVTIGQVKEEINNKLKEYLNEVKKNWGNVEASIIRRSQVESRVLSVEGVIDITDTMINGLEENITVNSESIPIFNEVILNV